MDLNLGKEAILEEAYSSAVTYFKQKLTKDEQKRIWLDGKPGINDVVKSLQEAKAKYDDRKAKQPRASKWLAMFSVRLTFYGSILDTLSQHHPEYVALAWGSIRFLFTAVLNHEESIFRLSKAFVAIADVLPRSKFKLEMYGTGSMSQAVAQLYAQIMRFTQRAVGWYTEGRIKHIYYSISQPFSLRYDDLVKEIKDCSKRIEQLAIDGSQVEQRQLHIEIRDIKKLLIAQHSSIVTSGLLNTPFQLKNIEITQILTFVDKTPLPTPETTYAYHSAMRNRRVRANAAHLEILEDSKQLKTWASQKESALIAIKGSFRDRAMARDLAASIIGIVKDNSYPVVWALTCHFANIQVQPSKLDVLKHLVLQILQVNKALLKDNSRPLSAVQFYCATTEAEWFELLCLVLSGLPQIYIVIDVEVFRSELENGQSWPAAFINLFQKLAEQSRGTVLKLALISYHTQLRLDVLKADRKNMIQLSRKKISDGKSERGTYRMKRRPLLRI